MILANALRARAPALRAALGPSVAHAPAIAAVRPLPRPAPAPALSLPARRSAHSSSSAEDYQSFNARYIEFFNALEDPFELMRGLNNVFIYDLVPSQEVIEAALRAARRCNDYALAVRVFDALKDKTDTKEQYEAYVRETEPLRKELGIMLADDLYERPITWRVPHPGP